MRDYLYLWNQPASQCLVVSGIEFRDLVPELATTGGVVLLRHRFDEASLDRESRLEFVAADQLARLAGDDIYGYGDFHFADFGRDTVLADLTDQAIAELLFFAHAARPLRRPGIPGLGNRLLYSAHDDGWHARIFYRSWDVIGHVLGTLLPRVVVAEETRRTLDVVRFGDAAVWCRGGHARDCEGTDDIDALQQEYLRS